MIRERDFQEIHVKLENFIDFFSYLYQRGRIPNVS